MNQTGTIENRTFDEIRIGDTASIVHTLVRKDVELFAVMSGDVNPTHVDEAFAKSDLFHKIVAHGMWGGALIWGRNKSSAKSYAKGERSMNGAVARMSSIRSLWIAIAMHQS